LPGASARDVLHSRASEKCNACRHSEVFQYHFYRSYKRVRNSWTVACAAVADGGARFIRWQLSRTIQLTSASSAVSGAGSNWCDTSPVISLSIQNNEFSYVLEHPNLPRDKSGFLSPIFVARVAPDGSFRAASPNGSAAMTGIITGSRMSGQINGTGCSYTFTAEKS
jgi:hypothetical protein